MALIHGTVVLHFISSTVSELKLHVQKHFIVNNMQCKSFYMNCLSFFSIIFRRANDLHVYSDVN